MFNQKSYKKSGYEYVECPRCDGTGLSRMNVFSRDDCPRCEGTGSIMAENSRETESARHDQSDNNERKNAWLFS